MKPVYVRGVGFYSPLEPSFADFGRPRSGPSEPSCPGFAQAGLRGTSLATRSTVHVALEAIRQSGVNPHTVPTVFGSNLGEVQTALALIRSMEQNAPLSPIRFKNSVHNTPAAIFGIAHENRAFSTSIGATDDLVPMLLLEAIAYLARHGGDVLVACAEEPLPAPLSVFGNYAPLAFAFVLSASAPEGASVPSLSNLRYDPRTVAGAVPVEHRGNACAAGLALLSALAGHDSTTVAFARSASSRWSIDVRA